MGGEENRVKIKKIANIESDANIDIVRTTVDVIVTVTITVISTVAAHKNQVATATMNTLRHT